MLKRIRQSTLHLLSCLFIPIFTGAGIACSNPIISPRDVLRVEDMIAPELTVIKPVEDSYYAAVVVVTGQVSDIATAGGIRGEIGFPLSYLVIGTNVKGEVELAADGSFAFSFSTDGFTGNKSLQLTARDWNSNKTEVVINLRQGAFPHFTASAGNREVTLTWDAVELTESYTLFYTDDGSTPSPEDFIPRLDTTKTSLLLENLGNGRLYSFLLRGNSQQAGENWSEVIQAIPVSPFTFAPRVQGEYGRIRVEWNPLPSIINYIIFRATSREGPYAAIYESANKSEYPDYNVENGTLYYYKIQPATGASLASCANSGQTIPIPPLAAWLGGEESLPDACQIVVKENHAYVAAGTAGLYIFNLAGPLQLQAVGFCETPGKAVDVDIRENYAYLACEEAGLQIVDISDPSAPFALETGIYNTPGYAKRVAVQGDFAYVADREKGLQVINIANPAAPVKAWEFATAGFAYGLALQGDYAFIAQGVAGLVILDITKPAAPWVADRDTGGCAYDIDFLDTFACVADGAGGLVLIDVSEPAAPGPPIVCDTAGNAFRLAIEGYYAYLADEAGGLAVINLAEPGEPRQVAVYKDAETVTGVALAGPCAYLACGEQGIRIVNTGGPHRAVTKTIYNSMNTTRGVALSGEYACLANSEAGLLVLDLSNPETPVPAGSLEFGELKSVYDVKVCGDYVFATGYFLGLRIISIADPANPQILSAVEIPDYTTSCFLQGDYLYVAYWMASGETGVKIYNIADPTLPVAAGGYEVDSYARGLTARGNFVLTANDDSSSAGLHIADVTDKTEPCEAGKAGTPGSASAIDLYENYAIIADGIAGLQLFNITDPLHPLPAASCVLPGFATDVCRYGRYALVAALSGGLQVVELTRPAALLRAASFIPGVDVSGIAARGNYAYLSLGGSGLLIVDLWPFAEEFHP